MISYFDDVWIAFLCSNIIRQCVELSELNCPGCEGKLKSPLLHLHMQLSLLEKLKVHFEEIRGSILPTVPELYRQFQHKLPHSDNLIVDEECYVSNGRHFLTTLTSEALYYGRYLNEFVDEMVDQGFKVAKKRKQPQQSVRTRKKAVKSTSLISNPTEISSGESTSKATNIGLLIRP